MVKVLVCEDDVNLLNLVSIYLKGNDFEVLKADNGLDGYNLFLENEIDIVLTDIMMPKLDGYSLASKIRDENNQIPIIFMSAKDDKPSKQLGYNVGIDDYIVKPFDIDEVIFKIKAIVRRLKIESKNEIVVGNLKMNNLEHTCFINDNEIDLTVREFDILYRLLQNPKVTYTRSKLMDLFWDFDTSATSRTVDVYMAKIRDKVKEATGFEIKTVHGLGYKVLIYGEK